MNRTNWKQVLLTISCTATLSLTTAVVNLRSVHADISMNPAYDLSQWQQQFTPSEVQALKSETSFVILRVQYGSAYQDTAFQNNLKLIQQYHIPYGVYSYSMYESNQDAAGEARQLHQLAPNALFYVNDIEENNITNPQVNSLNDATKTWGLTMKSLTNRPVVLYSGLDFMNNNIGDAKNVYNALWIASYSTEEPNPSYHYDLWQYTDQKYSAALNQNVDASIIPAGGKPLSFWTNSGASASSTTRKIKVQPTKHTTTTNLQPSAKKATTKHKKKVHHKKHSHKKTKATTKKKKASHHVGVHKGYNPAYYSDPSIKQLQVTSKTGVTVYNRYNQPIMQCVKGNVIQVKYFRRLGHITQAVTPTGNHFTANKKLVGQVHLK